MPLSQTPIASGTATVPAGGKSEIQQTVPGLTENKTYILVVRDGTANNCVMDTKIFTVLRSAQPLAFVQTDLLRNSACAGSANETAQIKVTIKDGTGPYKYTISQASTSRPVRSGPLLPVKLTIAGVWVWVISLFKTLVVR